MVAKTQKSNFCSILDTHLQQFFVSGLYPFDFMFSGIIWIDKRLNCDEKTCFPNSDCMKTGKIQFSVIIGTTSKSKKCFFKNMNLTDINYH